MNKCPFCGCNEFTDSAWPYRPITYKCKNCGKEFKIDWNKDDKGQWKLIYVCTDKNFVLQENAFFISGRKQGIKDVIEWIEKQKVSEDFIKDLKEMFKEN